MKGKVIVGVLALLVGGLALGSGQSQVQAATTYKVVKTKAYNDLAYHAKDTKKSAYMWNTTHTKKLHNLKNYPKTTWYLSKSIKLQAGKKSGIYYQVINNTGKVSGIVWRSYLTKGNNPSDKLAKNAEVLSYGGGLAGIKSAREAATLQVDILSLFPGTLLNTSLSADARTDLNAGVNKATKYSKTDSNKKAVGIFSPFNWTTVSSKTSYTAQVTAQLEKQGYTATKRASYKGWQIGIYATPHGYDSATYKTWTSGYGSWGVYLVPTDDILSN